MTRQRGNKEKVKEYVSRHTGQSHNYFSDANIYLFTQFTRNRTTHKK